jgi:ribonuclease P protein subunit RPR2
MESDVAAIESDILTGCRNRFSRRNRFIDPVATVLRVRRRKDNHRSRDLALQRMERLFVLAEEAHRVHPERSKRYVQIARRISTRTRVRMPRSFKRLYCRHCGSYLSPENSRVRLSDGVMITTCIFCNGQMRRPYKPRRE